MKEIGESSVNAISLMIDGITPLDYDVSVSPQSSADPGVTEDNAPYHSIRAKRPKHRKFEFSETVRRDKAPFCSQRRQPYRRPKVLRGAVRSGSQSNGTSSL